MPEQNTRRPAYFGLSTTPPRSTAISVSRIEDGEVGRGLDGRQRAVVHGVEKTRDCASPGSTPCPAGQHRAAEIDRAVFHEFRQELERSRPSAAASRGMRCSPVALVRQHMRQEDALIDLVAFFVLERERRFGGQFLFAGDEAGHELGGIEHQSLDADEIRPFVGELAVERLGVRGEELLAQFASLRFGSRGTALSCSALRDALARKLCAGASRPRARISGTRRCRRRNCRMDFWRSRDRSS